MKQEEGERRKERRKEKRIERRGGKSGEARKGGKEKRKRNAFNSLLFDRKKV